MPEVTESEPAPPAHVIARRSALRVFLPKIIALALALGIVILAWRLGLFSKDASEIKDALVGLGGWGYLAFVVAFTLLQPFGVPGLLFVGAASLIWPWPIAFTLSMIGALSASKLGFVFARFIARDWVAKRLPARFKKYNTRLAERGFSTVLLLRILFTMQPLLHLFFGLSKVKVRTHLAATALGIVVPIFVLSYFGERAVLWFKELDAWHWIVAGLVIIKLGLVAWGVRSYLKRRGAPAQPAPEKSTG